jgi:hypothetical protein
VSASSFPGRYSSVRRPRRAWQRAQVSTSKRVSRNFVGLAIPRSTSISHSRLRRSVKRTMRPGSPFGSCPLAFARSAHSAWREPGPWQASQETSISENVVRNRSSARS